MTRENAFDLKVLIRHWRCFGLFLFSIQFQLMTVKAEHKKRLELMRQEVERLRQEKERVRMPVSAALQEMCR